MNEKETLYERYEDAFFALLMAEASELEGKALLEENKALLADPNAAVPERVTRRSLKTIGKNDREKKARRAAHGCVRILNRAAVVVAIVSLLLVGVFAASETARVKTLNYVIEHLDVGTAFLFGRQESALQLDTERIWVPDGFSFAMTLEDSASITYFYENKAGDEIMISTYDISTGSDQVAGGLIIDTEDAEVTYPVIVDTEVMLSYKKGEYQAVWPVQEREMLILVLTRNVDRENVLNIVESLIDM